MIQKAAFSFLAIPEGSPRWKRWLIFSPYARLVILVACVAIGDSLLLLCAHAAGLNVDTGTPLEHPYIILGSQLIPVVAYVIVVRLIERRRAVELSVRAIPTLGIAGLAAGAGLMSAVVGILWLVGSYHVIGIRAHVSWVTQVIIFGMAAGISEEVLFRGGLFRLIEEGAGTWWALGVSSAFFGIAHIFNPGASIIAAAAIAIEAGLLLGLVYHVTRSLWPGIGMHIAWNVMEGTVFGVPVSGGSAAGWLISRRTGPTWLSGGAFGVEASVVALALCAACSLALLCLALRDRSIVRPSWVADQRNARGIPQIS